MKRGRVSSSDRNEKAPNRSNQGSFNKRNVEMGKAHAIMLNCVFFDVLPNICARSIESEKNYRTVSRLAQVCKDTHQKVKEFVFCISTYMCEETLLAKSDAICILESLAIHQAIGDQSIINNLVKNIMEILLDPQVSARTRTNAFIAAANTIDLADHINLQSCYMVALLDRMMNVLKEENIDEHILRFHGYIFTILNKLHDKGLINLTDIDQAVLKQHSLIEIMSNEDAPFLCRSNACLLFCKLVKNSLIDIDEEKIAEILYDALADYPRINMSIDALLSLDSLAYPENPRLNIGQAEFLRKYETEKFCIQSFEESRDMIDTLCDSDLDLGDTEGFSSIVREEYIRASIFPIINDLEEFTPKFVKCQVLILVALKDDLEEAIDQLGKSNASAVEKLMKLGLEMFNDSESFPYLKASILYIILSYMRFRFSREPVYTFFEDDFECLSRKALTYIDEHSFFYEIAGSLHELALSVINSNEYALAKNYYHAQQRSNLHDLLSLQQLELSVTNSNKYDLGIYSCAKEIIDLFSKYNILSKSSDSSESSDDFSESPDEL